ncbi:MAG: helix-turn-helix domain-containing protein [Allomuricauda sp.]
MGGETQKLLASQVIETDEAFIKKVATEVKRQLDISSDVGEKLYNIKEIAKLGKIGTQAVRKHIWNHLNNYDGTKLKAEKRGKLWYAKKKDVEEYLNIKLS